MRFRRKSLPAGQAAEGRPSRWRLSRRRFLIGSGAGLVVLFAGGNFALQRIRSGGFSLPELSSDPNSWLRIEPDGRVRLMINKVEMGQGIGTAAVQIVADELDVPVEQIELVAGDTSQVPVDQFGTTGSRSVAMLYPALRQAAATARQALVELAAQRSGKPAERLVASQGLVTALDDPAISFGYGELVAGKQIVRSSEQAAPLKAPASYTVIGQDIARLDIPDKVTGAAIYGYDARVEGMLHGRILRPPVIGATIETVDVEPARGLPGVVALVAEGDFIGVAAETPAQAAQALGQIAVMWRQPERLLQQADIEALLTSDQNPTILQEAGDVQRVLSGAARRLTAQYRTGFAAHAQIEPQAAVADVRADRATVWVPTQMPFTQRDQIADATGLKAEQVTVVPMLIGGGFGRKGSPESATEAARLSKAAGRPVRVAWDRTEEFLHSFMRPPIVMDFEAALDGQGRIVAWQQHLATGLVLFAFFPGFVRFMIGNDFGATRGAVPPYLLPNQRVAATIKELPVKTGTWRGLGSGPNAFAVEQFMDELALAAGADPVAFRLAHLDQADPTGRAQRMRRVIEAVAERAGWGTPLPADTGRGIACGDDAGTCVAEVAEVQVDRATGAVKVLRVVAAIDCGLAINPRNVIAQTEGGIMMGLSAALKEEITLKDGNWSGSDFLSYPIFTIADAPEIEVVLIENREAPPSGMGEPPLLPAAAAVGNAIAAATGARVRTMPMTPERVLVALQEAG
jgi:isoquinoline 1-oxidoreductase beta subunit